MPMPMNRPSWAIFGNSNMTKAQLSKAGPTASSTKSYCKSDGVIHNFFSHYSYCSSLTFSILMPSKIFYYKNTHSTQVSILPWHGWQVKKATLSVYTVAGEWPIPAGWLCWLQGFTLTHLLQTGRLQCEQQLCSPRPAQEAVYGLIWRSRQSLAFQFCSCHQPSAFLHLQIPTAKLVLIGCQNQNLTDNCRQSQVVETAEGSKVLHHSLPKSGCLISRIRNVVFIFCHPTELGISECQPQKPMCPCLDRMPTQGLYVWFALNSLRVNREKKRGRRGYGPESDYVAESLSYWVPKVIHCQRFLLLASCIFLCLLYNHTAHLGIQQRPAVPCMGNGTAGLCDLTTYSTPCVWLPQHVWKITPPAREKL